MGEGLVGDREPVSGPGSAHADFLGSPVTSALPHPAGLTSRPKNSQSRISIHLHQGERLNAGMSHLQMGKLRPRAELAQSKAG